MTVPLDPPSNYLPELVDYLHLEWGESGNDPDALKVSDLEYVGLFSIDQMPTYFWSYPGRGGSVHYATCEVYANTYCLGMTDDAPADASRIRRSEDCPALRTLDLGPQRSVPWFRRGPIGFVWNMFTMARVVRSTVQHMKDTRAESEELSRLPMTELLPRYVQAVHSESSDSYARPRQPAARMVVVDAQARLGAKLPDGVKAFYLLSDGLDWHNPLRNAPLPPLVELRWGREFDPPMSMRFRKAWEEDGRDDEEPEALQITADDLAGAFGANADEIPFAASDDMIVLSRPDGSNVLLLTMTDLPRLPKHSVIEAEGIYCTKYRDLPRWMASQVAIFSSLKALPSSVNGRRHSSGNA